MIEDRGRGLAGHVAACRRGAPGRVESKVILEMTPIGSVTLSDGRRLGYARQAGMDGFQMGFWV